MIQRWNIQGSEVTPDDEGNYVLYAHHRKKLEADRDWMRLGQELCFASVSTKPSPATPIADNARAAYRAGLVDAEREQEKALLRRRMLEREIDDLDEYCELLERFASKKAKGKAQRKFDKRRRDKAASGFAPGQKLIVGPNTVTFTGAEFAEGCADAEGFPPLVPNDDADRAENLKHDLEHKGWRDD